MNLFIDKDGTACVLPDSEGLKDCTFIGCTVEIGGEEKGLAATHIQNWLKGEKEGK